MQTLKEANEYFKSKGAIYYHDFWSNEKDRFGFTKVSYLVFRHYFSNETNEIGYVIPDMWEFGSGVHEFNPPRVWGISNQPLIRF